ncbi:Hypothetical predicted protein [Olea europaea subsp. europaea]|uniref:Uncharacterized protein n=1 Tax=Olea europaea subsp. europaea TaxID=158383 RepID=A0A8S0RPT0_OLEEU|nr:Hypothetical predicted protein [Olea europaea subsp. europaea]
MECLELCFCFYLALEDYQSVTCDVQAILTLYPDYRMFDGRVAVSKLRTRVCEYAENWTTADCSLQLYERWSSVDDIGSLTILYQMLESDATKGMICFRQSLILPRRPRNLLLSRDPFEAFFPKAYALADPAQDPSCSSTVVSLLKEALKCTSDRLRKDQMLQLIATSMPPKICHTRAHQGLAPVHFLRNNKNAAYAEMAKLIEKAPYCVSAYEEV